MARKPNQIEAVGLKFSTTPQVKLHLEQLVRTGLYGRTTSDAVDRLLGEALRRLMQEGILRRQPQSDDEA